MTSPRSDAAQLALQKILTSITSAAGIIARYREDKDPRGVVEAFTTLEGVFKSLREDRPERALAIVRDPELFGQLNDECKALLASECAQVMLEMLSKKQLEALSNELFSKLVCSLVLNINMLFLSETVHGISYKKKNNCTVKSREMICLAILRSEILMYKLSMPALMLLLAYVKKSELFCGSDTSLDLDPSLRRQILSAYALRTDFNPVYPWDSNPFPALVGFNYDADVYESLFGWAFSSRAHETTSTDAPCAAAELLIHCFSERLTQDSALNSDAHKKLRLQLAQLYPRIGQLILDKPRYRGESGEITSEDVALLAEMYEWLNPEKYLTLKVDNEMLRMQVTRLEQQVHELSRPLSTPRAMSPRPGSMVSPRSTTPQPPTTPRPTSPRATTPQVKSGSDVSSQASIYAQFKELGLTSKTSATTATTTETTPTSTPTHAPSPAEKASSGSSAHRSNGSTHKTSGGNSDHRSNGSGAHRSKSGRHHHHKHREEEPTGDVAKNDDNAQSGKHRRQPSI